MMQAWADYLDRLRTSHKAGSALTANGQPGTERRLATEITSPLRGLF